MNPLLEVNPGVCMVVVGPMVTRFCLSDSPASSLKLSYQALIQAGLDLVSIEDERGRLMQLAQDIDNFAKELTSVLERQGDQDQWLQSSLALTGVQTLTSTQTVQLLLNLQSKGCKLVYSYYDTILDTITGTKPILLSDTALLEQWLDGQTNGLLHIHGIYNNSSSIVLHTNMYDKKVKEQALFLRLKELFRQRTLIFIGHEADGLNPLLTHMTQVFLQDDGIIRNPPLFLSSTTLTLPNCFIHLPISQYEESVLHELIAIGSENNFIAGRSNDRSVHSVDKDIIRSQAVLIFSEKQSFRKLGDIIYQLNKSGEIYVRRDALTILFGSRIMYGNILTYGGNGLRQIWELVIPRGSVLQAKGLVAIGLQNALMVWVNRKPSGLGAITDVNTFHSLWNNSLTAISQSRMIPSPSTVVTVTPTAAVTPSPTYSSPSPFLHTPFATFPFSYPSLPSSFLPIVSPMTTLFPLNPMLTQIRPMTPTVLTSAANFPATPVTLQSILQPQTTPTSSSHPQFINTTCDPRTISSSHGLTETEIEFKEAAGPSSGPLRAESPVLWEKVHKNILAIYEKTIVRVEKDGKAVNTVKAVTRPVTTLSFEKSSSESARSVASTPLPQVRPILQSQLTGLPLPRSSRPTSLPTLLPIGQYSPHPLSLPTLSTLSPLAMFPSPFSLVPLPVTSLLSTVQTTPPTLSQISPMLPRQHVGILATTDYSGPSSSSSITHKHKSTFDSSSSSKRPAVILRSHSSPSLPTIDNLDETQIEASTQNYMSQTPLEGFGNLQQSGSEHLWQFLLHLLLSPNHGHIIQWTGHGYEFCIIDPTTLTKMWAESSKTPELTFHGLLGELQSFYGLGILECVEGKELTYQFVLDIQKYLTLCADNLSNKV